MNSNEIKVKRKPEGMIGIHRHKNAALLIAGEQFYCVRGYEPMPDGCSYSYRNEYIRQNPLEAMAIYEATFTEGLHIWFGDWLEEHGWERYTGLRKEAQDEPTGAAGAGREAAADY